MADLSRRSFLCAMPAAAVVASVAALPAIAAQAAPEPSEILALYGQLPVRQRGAAQAALRDEGLTDLADAFEAEFPSTVRWSGDGRYAFSQGKTRPVYWIIRAPEHDDAERWFKVSTGFSGPLEPKDWYCRESELPRLAYRLPEYSLQVGRGGNGNALVKRRGS